MSVSIVKSKMVGQQLNKKLDELEQWFKENPKLPEQIGMCVKSTRMKCRNKAMKQLKNVIKIIRYVKTNIAPILKEIIKKKIMILNNLNKIYICKAGRKI